MATHGVQAFLISHLTNLYYLTNVAASAGCAILTPRILYLVIDFRYSSAVAALRAAQLTSPDMEVCVAEASLDEAAAKLVGGLGVETLGVEGAHVSVDQFRWWQTALPGVSLVSVGRVVEGVRLLKDAFEIATFREAGSLVSKVAATVLDSAVRAGRSELAIAADLDWELKQAGFSRPAFETIVASGPNAALPHARPTDRRLARGDLVVLDFGGVYGGYCVDVTRTVAVGEASDEARAWHRAVCAAQAEAMAALRPGTPAHDVDAAARQTLEAHGYGAAFGHATGHGLGLDVHEDPRLGRLQTGRPSTTLQPGMVCTVEPGVYYPGVGGVRIEDDVLITEEGPEKLTDIPYDLVLS